MELWAITPELTLATGFLLPLAWAPFVDPQKSFRLYLAAVAILAAATILTLRMLPWRNQSVFHGTYVLDPVAHFMKLYALAARDFALPPCAAYFRATTFRPDIPALLVSAALGGAMMAGSADLALVILFFYIVTVSTLIFVGVIKQDDRGNGAALKYFLYGAVATAIMLYGVSFLYGLSGTCSLVSAARDGKPMLAFALMLALVGFGFKMAIAPFHMWAPDVYEGSPTPIAGYLSVMPKAAAIVVVLRLLHGAFSPITESWQSVFAIMAGLTMTVGNILAFGQTNMKRLLAYASIAQIGYILAAIAISGV